MEHLLQVKKNDIVEIYIEDIGSNGEGIGKHNGFTLFVKGAVTGDRIKALILKVKKSYGYAKLMDVLEESPHRVKPLCPIAARCGGCQLQHVSYELQQEYKKNKVMNCLRRIGGAEGFNVELLPQAGEPYYYRNKAQFPVGRDRDGNAAIGFYAEHSHSIIDSRKCYIQPDIANLVIGKVREFVNEERISIYDEKEHLGLIRHVLIRLGFNTGDVMVCMVVNGDGIAGRKKESEEKLLKLVDKLREVEVCQKEFKIKSVCLNKNVEKTNVILGEEIIPVYGEDYITEYIGEVKYRISPLSFFQVNPYQMVRLYDKVMEYVALSGNEVVWDLYCGIGTISLYLAKKAKMVYGVEVVTQAVQDAVENARMNGIENAVFFAGAAEEVMAEKYKQDAGMRADVVVVDPPRKGCEAVLLDAIADMGAEKVVYVSCDPGTLARDVKYLGEKGYVVEDVAVVDQFAMTVHVETVCLLSKLRTDYHIEVNLNMDELDLTSAESKATYEEIKEYVLENSGLKVSSLYIAQVKEKMGIKERENYNHSKKEDANVPQCPADKEKAIVETLKHFSMIG